MAEAHEARPPRRIIEIGEDGAHLLPDLAQRFSGGVVVRLGPGDFVLDRTIRIGSNTEIHGAGMQRTRLVLKPGANCHLLSNADPVGGNRSIVLAGFSVHGNAASQQRPEGHRATTYACGMHLAHVRSLRAADRRSTISARPRCTCPIAKASRRSASWPAVSDGRASRRCPRPMPGSRPSCETPAATRCIRPSMSRAASGSRCTRLRRTARETASCSIPSTPPCAAWRSKAVPCAASAASPWWAPATTRSRMS